MKALLSVVILVVLCGCAGTHFTWDKADQVKMGMKDDEVIKIMGKPYLVNAFHDYTEWIYAYGDMFGSARSVKYNFDLDGKVTSTPRIPKSFLSGNTNQAPVRADLQRAKH